MNERRLVWLREHFTNDPILHHNILTMVRALLTERFQSAVKEENESTYLKLKFNSTVLNGSIKPAIASASAIWPFKSPSKNLYVVDKSRPTLRSMLCNFPDFATSSLNKQVECSCFNDVQNFPLLQTWYGHLCMPLYEYAKITGDRSLQRIADCGLKFRWPLHPSTARRHIIAQLNAFAHSQRSRFNVGNDDGIQPWIDLIMSHYDKSVHSHAPETFDFPSRSISQLVQKYVVTPIDRAAQNASVTCRKLYADILEKIRKDGSLEPITHEAAQKMITATHQLQVELSSDTLPIDTGIPYLYWIPKFSKRKQGAVRTIIGTRSFKRSASDKQNEPISTQSEATENLKCLEKPRNYTTSLGKLCAGALRAVIHRMMWESEGECDDPCKKRVYINLSHRQVISKLREIRAEGIPTTVRNSDMGTMYISLDAHHVRAETKDTVRKCFGDSFKQLSLKFNKSMCIDKARITSSMWKTEPTRERKRLDTIHLSENDVCKLIDTLVGSSVVISNGIWFKQRGGITIGGPASGEFANVNCMAVEMRKPQQPKAWSLRNVDDTLMSKNFVPPTADEYHVSSIITSDEHTHGTFTGIQYALDKTFSWMPIDKRTNFPFAVTNFPHFLTCLPKHVFIGTLLSIFHRCYECSSSLKIFIDVLRGKFMYLAHNRSYPSTILHQAAHRFIKSLPRSSRSKTNVQARVSKLIASIFTSTVVHVAHYNAIPVLHPTPGGMKRKTRTEKPCSEKPVSAKSSKPKITALLLRISYNGHLRTIHTGFEVLLIDANKPPRVVKFPREGAEYEDLQLGLVASKCTSNL